MIMARQNTDKRQIPRIKEIINACLFFDRKFFSLSQIVLHTLIGRDIVRHKLWKLEKAGLIIRVKEKILPKVSKGHPEKEICYRNTKLLEKKAEGMARQAHHASSRDKMWKAARALRRFTINELTVICGAEWENVRTFVKRYKETGYFRQAGKRGKEIVWMLCKDTGPRRPTASVIPAKAGIQREKKDTGFRVKHGMTEKAEGNHVD